MHFEAVCPTDRDDSLCDLLCNLMHMANNESIDFDAELARAAVHYEAELDEEEITLVLSVGPTLELMTDACCIWEAVLDQHALKDWLGDVGAAEHRDMCARMVPFVNKAWHYARAKYNLDVSYDWDFVPPFLLACVDLKISPVVDLKSTSIQQCWKAVVDHMEHADRAVAT